MSERYQEPAIVARRRAYDEKVMREQIDGLSRIYSVLQHLSATTQALVEHHTETNRLLERALGPPPEPDGPKLLSIKEAAAYLGLPETSLYRAHETGPVVTRVGRRRLFQRQDLDHWLETQRDPIIIDSRQRTWQPGAIGSTLPAPPAAPGGRRYCSGSGSVPLRSSQYQGRGICPHCQDDVLITLKGRLRKHLPRLG